MKYINQNNKEYIEYNFEDNEEVFERDIVKNAKNIFGEKTVYIDIKTLLKPNKKSDGTIPDGYLLDFTIESNPRLYLVENEVRNHSIKNHIAPQIMNFFLNYKDSFIKIKNEIIKYLESKNISIDSYMEKTSYRNIDDMITSLVFNEKLGVIIVIDEADERLYELKNGFGFDLEILEFKKYNSKDNDTIYVYDKFNEQEEISNDIENINELNTILVAAYEDGFQSEFLENNRWYAVSIGINRIEALKYIAVYQKRPVKAITYYAEIDNIQLYNDTGKYIIYFKDKAKKLKQPIPLNPKNPNKAPQGRVYTNINKILNAKANTTMDDIF